MKTEEEIRDLIHKLKTTDFINNDMTGAIFIKDAIKMSIMNLEWVLESEQE